MKAKHIFTLLFSLVTIVGFSQEKKEATQDSISKKSWHYTPNFMVGIDVLNLGTSFFSDRKAYQGFVSTRILPKVHAVADLGFEKNTYTKNNYNAEAQGQFLKLGAFYMLSRDHQNHFNGFYAGGKMGMSFYNQEYFKIPIRGFQGGDYGQAFPKSNQSSYWVEGSVGGRVQLFESKFYIDVNVQPRYLLFTTKQDEIYPMIVPGFGQSSTKFNVGFSWNLAYQF